MRGRAVLAVLLVLGLALVAARAGAEKFRYSGGPQAPADTALSVAVPTLEPIVRARGPRVPLTNLQLVTLVARAAFETGLKNAPLDSGGTVVLAPASDHPLNFVAEYALLRLLARRGVSAVIHRAPAPGDSALTASDPAGLLLEYQVASARVTYIRLRGWLPGRVKIERQGLVEARISLRDPRTSTVRWSGDATHNLVDAFPRGQLSLVEDPRYPELKGEVPGRSVDKVVEPVIVVSIVGGLIALFFQNRP
jgi:hypothetical protein